MRARFGFPVALCALAVLAGGCRTPNLTYKKLKLTRPTVAPVTDADVRRAIDRIRDRAASAVPLAAGTRLARGHRAIIDFAGRIGGTPFDGGTGSSFPIVLGSGQMIPGFEEGILGMRAGDTKLIRVTFPKDYQEATLAGKPAEFTVTVRGAESLVRPDVDAAFCRQISGGQISDPAELRKAVRQNLEQQTAQRAEASVRSQVAEALLGQWSPEPSRREVNRELDRYVQQTLQAAAANGQGPAQGGPDAESIRSGARAGITKSLRLSKVLARIAKLEGLSVTDGEVEQFATQIANSQRRDPQAFLADLRQQNQVEFYRRQMLEDRVMRLILQNAILESPQPLRAAAH